ncbi:MAG: hypothetical protein COB93_01085 [Sneathiella sp.]|nr:MAG: hypothetical protein COB93_01085 [Sneathiella sp.]
MITVKSITSRVLPTLLLAVIITIPSVALADMCQPEAESNAALLLLPKEKIKNIFTTVQYGSAPGIVTSVDGWVSFNDCKGNLVFKFGRTCQLLDTYTTGSCNVVGVKNY